MRAFSAAILSKSVTLTHISIGLLVAFLSFTASFGQTVSVIASSTPLNCPEGLVIDSSGNRYISNACGPGGIGASVVKIAPDGTARTLFTTTGPSPLYGLALDGANNLFIADYSNDRVVRVTPGGAIDIVADAAQGISGPDGLAVDGQGNLYIANDGDNTIRQRSTNGTVSIFVPSSAGLNFPRGLAFDKAGNLFVANLDAGVSTPATTSRSTTTSGCPSSS